MMAEEFEVNESSAKYEYRVSDFAYHQNPARNEKKANQIKVNVILELVCSLCIWKRIHFNKEGKEKGFFFDNLTFSYNKVKETRE